jgi:hypothetical protein
MFLLFQLIPTKKEKRTIINNTYTILINNTMKDAQIWLDKEYPKKPHW